MHVCVQTSVSAEILYFFLNNSGAVVCPCHHGMARPQIADEGTASSMEGSCEYIEKAVAHN